ncbi:phage major capsid protein [Priestia megaterium]|uniref:phage major capsid protein n=1 Tax=Priestia megaterium TaxID=1404 RepID=UPI002E24540E|nr:phage major capsid protein [Priestia megaterium]MED4061698.1 phage major capsid protein [Priestia megaterium]
MKKFLSDLIARKNQELADLKKRSDASTDVNEVRSIGAQMDAIRSEIDAAQAQLAEIEAGEARSATPAFNPMQAIASATMNQPQARSNEDPRATMEYRTAFMNYVQRGEKSPILQYEQRTSTGTSADLDAGVPGVLIPQTVIQEIMTGVEKVYGQLYSRVKKTNIKGGVKYPIGSFSASFSRITEAQGVSSRTHAGEVTGYVEFSYNIGEIRLARTLLQTVLSVPVFEQEFSKVIVKAYVEAMDKEIMVGSSASYQCEGILTEAAKVSSRIPSSNIITFTEAEMADWKAWQTNLFAKIPLSMRGLRPEFVMTANTYEANIKTLKDNNNRPLYNETFNPVDGAEICTFKGKQVVLVEEDILGNFNDIDVSGDDSPYFGMYWVPEKAYAINTNLEFAVIDYFDQETNQYVKKAIVINDGKILDPKYLYLLKKVAPSA